MKRRDVITLVSLRLFNEVGEANLAAIDIANELDISPGNLYYHFKGKEQIIAELFKNFSAQLNELLNGSLDEENFLVDTWLHVYVMLELIYEYRFLFRNINDLKVKYPETGKRLIRLLERLREGLQGYLVIMTRLELASIDSNQKTLLPRLANNLLLILLYWDNFRSMVGEPGTKRDFVDDACMQFLAQIAPYLSAENMQLLMRCHASYLQDNAVSGE